MKVIKLSLILNFIGITLLLGGCAKQEPATEPETVMNILVPPEILTEANTIPESAAIPPSESAASATPGQVPAAETPPAPQTPKTENAASDNFITVSKDFYVSDTWISTISFQIPENWSYRTDEDPSDWGFWIDIPDQKGFTLHIHALPGTFNVESFYTAAPTEFTTACGMKGKFYQEKSVDEDGIHYMEGDIVFDQPSSGISFLANESTYNQYMDTLQKIFLSVTIKDTYIE